MTTPVKPVYTGQNVTALAEFATGDAVPIASGGTGATTQNAAMNNILPAKTGASGKFLRVNIAETDYELATVSGGGTGGQTNTVTAQNGLQNTGDNVDAILSPVYGTTVNTVCQGNDSRLSDARTPTSHKSTHATGGGDALTASDIGAATSSHNHTGTYEPVDATILRQANLSGTGSATTPARSDHNHDTAYEPVNANIQSHISNTTVHVPSQTGNSGKFLTTDGATLSWGAVSSGGGAAIWTSAGSFTRSSNYTLTVTDNATNQAIYIKGRPLRMYIASSPSTKYYSLVTNYSAGAVTLSTDFLTTSIDTIEYGDMTRVVKEKIAGGPGWFYADSADNTLLTNDLGFILDNFRGKMYLVHVAAYHKIADTGATQPTINMAKNVVDGSALLWTTALSLGASQTTVQSSGANGFSATNYVIDFGTWLEVKVTNGTNSNAQGLSLSLIFVME